MKWAMFLALSISTTSFANTDCQKTRQYDYYSTVSAINSANKSIELSKASLRKYERMRPTYEVNEKINNIILQIDEEESIRHILFSHYRNLGGQANSVYNLERLKSPCSDEYSDDSFLKKFSRYQGVPDKIKTTPRTQTPMQEHFIKPHQQEHNHNPFDRSRSYNNENLNQGNGQTQSNDRQGESNNGLKNTLDMGINLYKIFK